MAQTKMKAEQLAYFPNRNAIINGGMDVWQRGTATLVSPASGTFFPDRFRTHHVVGDGTFDWSQSAETPSAGFPFNYSLKIQCTHIETAVAAGEYAGVMYNMEGYDFKRFEGETATLSFWVRATKTGIYCVGVRPGGDDPSYVCEYTVNTTNTWEKKSVTITFNSGGTFLYTNGVGLRIVWSVNCGSTFQTTPNEWQAGKYFATANQVNGLDNVANAFSITGVQMELSSVATPFEFRPIATELAMCQRYYQLVVPCNLIAINTTSIAGNLITSPKMRYAPTATQPNPLYVSDVISNIYQQSSGNITVNGSTVDSMYVSYGNFTGLTAGLIHIVYTTGIPTHLSAEL